VPERVSVRAEFYGRRVRDEAERQKMTARDLAERVGVTESAVSRWFAGTREIGDDHRIAVARALGMPLLALFPPMTAAGELVA
jgi:transcriptional regulator with XRE-family HTH domain